ncbi:MAG: tetratricopeptide repeat protein [Chryseolinea sp.]
MTPRIEQLEQFVKDEPHDPFNIYALALEYQKFDIPKALVLFEQLVISHPIYVPTYYHLAKLQEFTGDIANALQTFKSGMMAAQTVGDHKAMRELKSALEELEE